LLLTTYLTLPQIFAGHTDHSNYAVTGELLRMCTHLYRC